MENLDARFMTHPLSTADQAHVDDIRERAIELAHLIADETPPSREQSLALTKLEEAVFWAVAAVARPAAKGE